MSNIQTFNFEQNSVRVFLDENNNPLFVAKDVATTLGYARPNDAIKQHCKGAVIYRTLSTKGGNQEMRVIYEPDVYRLIFGSKLDGAIKFQNWVFDEVLPSIRKTGTYRHTISETQAHAISKAVKQKCQDNKTHYQTLYHALYDEFGITSYKELLACDFEVAMAFIMGFEFAPVLNVALIQNILADTAYQNKKAQHEIDGIIHIIKGLLHHIEDVQNRLSHSERCVMALQQRFIA